MVTLSPVLQLPDLKDAEAVQKFFLEEIQQGEELLAQGTACPGWAGPGSAARSSPPWFCSHRRL